MRELLCCFLVRLYPPQWRERYAAEFTALLEDSTPRFVDIFDILQGAMEMQLKNWTFGRIVAAFVVAGLLTGLGVAIAKPPQYISKAMIEHRSDRPEEALTTLRKTLGSEFDTWSSGLQIRLDGGKLIELSFASADANDAQSRNKALVQKLTGAEDFGLVQLSRTQQPIPPIYSVAIGWGIAGGLVLGSTAALMRRSARAAA